jgi:hypothetical protein
VDPHPDSNNCELKDKQNKLVYRHVLLPGALLPEEEEAGIDRRFTAPKCRDLYVTVEAQLGECCYDISVSFGNIVVVLTRQEITAQIGRMKGNWEIRVQELQRDPLAREEFDDHLTRLRSDALRQKRELAKGLNCVQRNKGCAREWSPTSKAIGSHKRALQNYARQVECSQRRAELQLPQENSQWGTPRAPSKENFVRGFCPRSCLNQAGAAICRPPAEAAQVPAITAE